MRIGKNDAYVAFLKKSQDMLVFYDVLNFRIPNTYFDIPSKFKFNRWLLAKALTRKEFLENLDELSKEWREIC